DIHRYTFSGVAECLLAPAPSPTFERLFKRFAARLTLDRMEDIEKDIEKSRGMSEAERFVLQYRCKHLLEDLKRKAIDLRPSTRERGEAKEELAARYMEKRGYKIWERNFRLRRGEIDIIANQADLIIFVEVKSRTSESFGKPFESVTKRKRQTLQRMAETYLVQRGLYEGWNVRFDVISIMDREGKSPEIEHFEDAFRPE
ncbi:MAG: YraN family protein, partial [bacterium]